VPTTTTALVTGASRGIGRAIAERLGADGRVVAVHYANDAAGAEKTVAAIAEAGGRGFAVQADLATPDGVDLLVAAVQRGLTGLTGDPGLDILVNNAGVMGGAPPEEITAEQFDRLLTVNAKAPFFLVTRLTPVLRDDGRIVNVSSALTRMAFPQEAAYAMSKAALEQISLHFARHLAPRGITVNTVGLGVTDNGSEMLQAPEVREALGQTTAFRRIGDPADVAGVVAFLASPAGRWMTGSWIDVSGGTLLG
jgi:bifunctional oxygenase/reductase